MLKLRTDVAYVKPDGKLTQAGVEAIQGQLDANASSATVAALDARVTTIEGYARRVLLATRTASASATLDFTEFNNASYRLYEFDLDGVRPATDATTLWVRLSTNGGASYDAGASDYAGVTGAASTSDTATTYSNSGGAAQIILTFPNNVGNAAGEEGVSGRVTLIGAPSTRRTRVHSSVDYDNTAGLLVEAEGKARRNAAQDTDAVRFLFSSGNITSGTIRMYGLT